MTKLCPMGCEQKLCVFIFIKMKLLALIFPPTSWKMEMTGKILWIPTEMLRVAELLTSQGSYVSSWTELPCKQWAIIRMK